MIKPLIRMGNPLLRIKSDEIGRELFSSDFIKNLAIDMMDSMKHYGGIGIAAPQIGVSLQMALIDLPQDGNRYGTEDVLDPTFFINPKMTILDPTPQSFWEGCLSVPGLRGFVERPIGIRVDYLTLDGEEKTIEAHGFLSTVLQHELDHLFGKLYVDRIKDMTKFCFQEEFTEFYSPKINETLDE